MHTRSVYNYTLSHIAHRASFGMDTRAIKVIIIISTVRHCLTGSMPPINSPVIISLALFRTDRCRSQSPGCSSLQFDAASRFLPSSRFSCMHFPGLTIVINLSLGRSPSVLDLQQLHAPSPSLCLSSADKRLSPLTRPLCYNARRKVTVHSLLWLFLAMKPWNCYFTPEC